MVSKNRSNPPPKKMGSTTEIDKDNIIPATYEHLPKDVCRMLEERKKKRDEDDLQAALASIKVDRRGKVTKINEIVVKSPRSMRSISLLPPRMHLLR